VTTPTDAIAATQRLAALVSAALSSPAAEPGALRRVETPIETLPPLEWLGEQRDFTQYYWSDREGVFTMAGVGEAAVLTPNGHQDLPALFAALRQPLSPEHHGLRWYGGFRFSTQARENSRWRAFAAYRFVVPRFEIVRSGEHQLLACNVALGSPEENRATLDAVLADLPRLAFPRQATPVVLPRAAARKDLPDRADWNRLIETATHAFQQGALDKVVLARETAFQGTAPWDPVALLRALARHSTRSFEFCFHPVADRAFIGASPERLYRRVNRFVQTEAVAGTRPRGRTDEEDRAYIDSLVCSDKERREHQFVVSALREHLDQLCGYVVTAAQPGLMQLRTCQHLHTTLEGILHDAECDAELIARLHPTPAVGGVPRDAALAWLDAHEPFDRGIYAAPAGWVGYDGAEFCVAIRSGLVRDETLAVYTGAGIVAGSTADEEWAEIETKMTNFLDALHHGPR